MACPVRGPRAWSGHDRGAAALGLPGSVPVAGDDRPDGLQRGRDPGRYDRDAGGRRRQPRSTGSSPTPTRSTSGGMPSPTSPSAMASISASAMRWRGWSRRSSSPRWCAASPTCSSPSIRSARVVRQRDVPDRPPPADRARARPRCGGLSRPRRRPGGTRRRCRRPGGMDHRRRRTAPSADHGLRGSGRGRRPRQSPRASADAGCRPRPGSTRCSSTTRSSRPI